MSGAGTASADQPLRVRVLGGFVVEGFEERELGTRKARVLLKRLAVALGRPVTAEELTAVVWPDGPPANPGDQVSVLVSRLRAVLGSGRIPRSDAGYQLAADWYDVLELEQRCTQIDERLRAGELGAALAAAHVALDLAADTLLPEELGDWVDAVRPAAERLVARSRVLAATAACGVGEYDAARAAAQAVLDQDPYDEVALRLVMKSDALAGRPGMALASYADHRQRLAEDLGADPAPETEALHLAIVRGELTAESTAAAPAAVVGRAAERAGLDRAFADAAAGASTSIVIEAEAGMGKSTLLAAWRPGAPDGDALVLAGRCDELGADLPLQPIIDGLAAHLDSLGRGTATRLLGDDAVTLGPLLYGTTGVTAAAVTTVADADASRAALFGSLTAVIRRAAGRHPVVLSIDDLHNAAPGTAEFLGHALRRIPNLLVVATRRPGPGPDLPAAVRIRLGPLDVAAAIELVGEERGAALHARSGGHPLLLTELTRAAGEELPTSVVTAVRAQLDQLGPASLSLEAAAVCGGEIDASLVAVLAGRAMADVLDDLEQAARFGLLRPRGAALTFGHELVREAAEAATSPPRRTEFHRLAVAELVRRPSTDPLALARHARLGGDADVAAQALVAAAATARERFEVATAEELLDEAVALADSVPARLARGRLRISRLDLAGAATDAARAIELGAGVAGFELAGWVAYYSRDYDGALRYAEEGVARATDDDVRASCLALAGRVRHTRGDLAAADRHFQAGVAIAPPQIRSMLQIWQAQLLAHRGEPALAIETARRGLLDPHIGHPFAPGHARFTVAYALAVCGRWSAAMDEIEQFDALLARQGDKRFPPVAANVRGWLLRGSGRLAAAIELHTFAAEAAVGQTFLEARYAALLDLAECHVAAGDLAAAGEVLAAAADVFTWNGSMSWRHRGRCRLVMSRLASLGGNHDTAESRAVASAATERGDARYRLRAEIVTATIDARAGRGADPAALRPIVTAYAPLAGPDGWRDLAELAAASGSEEIGRAAEQLAATVVAAVAARSDGHGDEVTGAVRRQLEALGQ